MLTKIKNLLKKIERIVIGTAKVSTYAGGFLLFLLMILISFDAVGRYIFNDSLKGTLDIVEFIMVLVVFLSIGEVAALNAHVRVTLLIERFSINLQVLLNISSSLISLVIAFLMARQLALRGWDQIFNPISYSQSLELPLAPIYLAAASGLFLLSLVLFIDFIRCLSNLKILKTNP